MSHSSNISSLFGALQSDYYSNEWRLFINLSKASLKTVLLTTKWKKNPSIFICTCHCTNRKPQNHGVNSALNKLLCL